MDRRHFLSTALASGAAAALPQGAFSQATGNRIGITDWTIGGRSSLTAFDLAKEIGLGSVQASFTPLPQQDDTDLRTERDREALLIRSEETGVAIASTAMSIFNKHPFKQVPEAVEWARQGVEATHLLGLEVMLMAFFSKNDLKGDAEGTAETIKRLKEVAPLAEEKGITLGLETTLSADEHLHIIDSVGSPAVQVYYDLGNSHANGYAIDAEIRQLGRELICEVHCKDRSGELFGEGEVDFKGALQALEEIGYDRWYVLEGGKVGELSQSETMKQNATYLRETGYSS